MDQHVDALAEIYEVVARAGVFRDRDRASGVIYSITEGGFDRAMIHEECGDLHSALVIDGAFANVAADHFDALRRCPFVDVTTEVDVVGECLFEVPNHVSRAVRSPDFERHVSRGWRRPRQQHEGRQVDEVIG